ncbi:MAG: proteasome subunit beta [Candidatus Lokiarchaeota archaeon]|nr:proteasome subunit beta [Candidatus Lokiarchaeota archaeon]
MKLLDSRISLDGREIRPVSDAPKAQEVQIVIPGAVSIGIKCADGIVLANERRSIWGYTVISESVKKVFRITEQIGLTIGGLISDMQMLTKILRANANLYELDKEVPMKVKSLTKLLANFLYQRKMAPFYTQIIVGGVDGDGPQLFTLDPIGSLIPDDFAAVGSSTTLAISILEAEYSPSITVEKAKALAEKAIVNSIKRDATVGGGIDMLIITKAGSAGLSKDLA